jgi:predicted lipid-binding transport protein (Tim44 family)
MAHHIGQYDSKLFMKNSLSAFEYIQELYANQQIEFLNKLASGAALERFTSRITELKQQGHQEVIAIIAVKDVELEEVHIANDHVLANVRFKTEQILYVKDTKAIEEEKMVVSGSQTKIVQYNELWTFSKKVNDESGTWMLVDFSK